MTDRLPSAAANPSDQTQLEVDAALAGLTAVLDPVPGAWFITRQDTSLAYVSRSACQWLGYEPEDLLTRSILDVDPNLSREMWDQMWSSSSPPDTLTIQTVHRRKDGGVLPVEVRAVRMLLGGQDFAVSYAIDRSQTEHTRAALEASEAQHQRLLDHLPDLVFRIRQDDNPRFSFVSPSCQRLLGYSPEEMLQADRGVAEFIHPDDFDQFSTLCHSPEGRGPRIRFVHKQGHWVWMDLRATAQVAEDTGTTSVEGVARDVTDSHEAELSNRRLLSAIEQVGEAVVVTNATGNVVFANAAYQKRSGLSLSEAENKPWRELEVRSDVAFLQRLKQLLATGESWKGRVQSVALDARSYDEEISISPLRDRQGAVVGCVAVKRDITEWLQIQEKLHQSQKLEAVGQLAGGIAHDFNNLLQIVQGNSLAIAEKELDPEVSTLIGGVMDAVQRASSLVRQLLTFSRKGTVEYSAVDLVDCVWSLREMLQSVVGSQIQVHWRCSVSKSIVQGNAAQLEQVVVNLCINARDAMPEGGILQLSAQSVKASELPSVVQARTPHLQLSVSDNGQGMDASTLSRLYEPFFTTKETGKGTGLGLASVYAIVQAHGGCIEVDSTPGIGTTFRMFFPLTEGPPAPKAIAPKGLVASSKGRLALVAEDEPAILALTARFLQSAGFEVLSVANGAEALRVLTEHRGKIDVAIVDVVMPQLGGLALFQQLKTANYQLPIVFVTGFDRDTLAEVIHHPQVGVLTKPFSRQQLLAKVGALLNSQ